jgi:3-dehydroquinate synthase
VIMKFVIDLPGSPPLTSQVFVGEDFVAGFSDAFASCLGKRTTYWIWDEKVFGLWHDRLRACGWPGQESDRLILFPASEHNKRLASVEKLAERLIHLGADRGSALVAVGGGVTGDVVGFLASIYMRGVPHIQVPTTLLAQVDSSIGGKTGVDLEAGKNLLGAFHQPQVIWMDLRFLETLPPEEFRQGMAEVIKTAMIGDESLWNYLEANAEPLKHRQSEALCHVVAACGMLKAKVVQADEKEAGLRRTLNLGHTVGHALERLSGYQLRHGDAVAMGLVAAAKVAVSLGMLQAEDLVRTEKLCRAWDLPVRIPGRFSPEAVLMAMQTDKKVIGGRLHFILPVRIGEVVDCQDLSAVRMGEVLKLLQDR